MNKFLLSFTLLSASIVLHAMEDKPDDSVVQDSSYFVYEGATGTTGGIPTGSKLVTFYTFDGRPLKTIAHKFYFPIIERKLDQKAPKPQPTEYEIKYWAAHAISLKRLDGTVGTVYKGVPGNFILFYDKNGNIIERDRFDEGSSVQNFSNKLDLSIVKQRLVEEAKKQ